MSVTLMAQPVEEEACRPVRVLVVGGASGYFGQILFYHLSNPDIRPGLELDVRVTTRAPPTGTQELQLDLRDQNSIAAALETFSPDVVINTAAISQPGRCEADEETANETNVPRLLVDALKNRGALLIHLSTDQVFDGSRSNSTESAPTSPINAYGRSKLKAEEVIRGSGCPHVILRSSIIVGPEVPGVERPLFVQFIRNRLQEKIPTSYLVDEVRNPIYAVDICRIIQAFISSFVEHARRTDGNRRDERDSKGDHAGDADQDHRTFRHTFNMGGVDRLSRLEMARAVARAMGLDGINIGKLIIPCTSDDLARPYRSPLDISMDSSAVYSLTGVQPLSFEEMLGKIIF